MYKFTNFHRVFVKKVESGVGSVSDLNQIFRIRTITLVLKYKNIGLIFADAMCPETKDFDSYWIQIPAGSVNPNPDGREKIAPGKKRRIHDSNFPRVKSSFWNGGFFYNLEVRHGCHIM
jgi:hypothetical protein